MFFNKQDWRLRLNCVEHFEENIVEEVVKESVGWRSSGFDFLDDAASLT